MILIIYGFAMQICKCITLHPATLQPPPHTISGNLGSCSLAFSGKSGNCMNMKIKMVYGLPTILYIFKLTKLYLNLAIESRKHIQFAQYFISPNCRSNSRFSGSSYILKFQFVLFCMY